MAEQIKLVNDDFQGHVDILRHACRGILVREGKVLLCCESDNDKYIINGSPGKDHLRNSLFHSVAFIDDMDHMRNYDSW